MKKLHLLLALTSALALTACGGSPEEAPVDKSMPTEAPVATIAPTPEPTPEPPVYEQYKVLGLSFDGNVEDSSATGISASLSKDGAYVEGVSGQALALDGSTYIDLGTDTSLQPENLTFTSWIKVDENLAGEHMITWFKPSGNYQGEGWYLSCLDNNTPLKLSVGKAAGQPMEMFVSGSRAEFFPVGEWVHIAVTYDSAVHSCNIYRNGVAQDVQYINEAKEIHADENSHKYIGFNSPGYNGGFAKMTLDELAIYNQVLSSNEVIELYTAFGAEFDGSKVVTADYNSLGISLKSIKNDITLPTQGAAGSTITWSSSDENILSPEGKVTRPASGENDAQITLTATLSYADFVQEKSFEICVEAEPAFGDLQDFAMGDVTLLDAYETNAFALEVDYLKSLDADRLLKGFCTIAGIESDAALYGGWENSAIKGHTLGHYLTALSQAYATSGDKELLKTTGHIVEVLAKCQNEETGYLAAIPESHYTQIENGNTSGTWVPWYTMHKVLAGLIDAYELTGNEQALNVASSLGDWVYSRTSTWSEATQATVLNVEYGGMNDCLYQLYSHTGNENHLSAAHSFDEMDLFESLYNGEDVLNGLHANTTIPKIVGALNRYMVLGESEEYYLQVAENFWEIVVNNHTYITGGNSEWEHFGEANILDAERTNCNCETCNTYNMLKLTRELFKITGNSKYSAYYENTFINAILSSQNPRTGMTTYFQPMATGYFKVYSSETGHFWCCTGSGMENFSKLGDSIYYKDENSIYVTRFTSSQVCWEEKGLTLTQETDIPYSDTATFTVKTDGNEVSADIVLYVPDWTSTAPTVAVNGTVVNTEVVNNYIRLSGPWKDGDVITYTLPMEIVVYNLPDNENVVAFKYGPIVLSADLGTEDMATGSTGVNVTVPTLFIDISDVLAITDVSIEDWLANINDKLVRKEDTLEFTLTGTDRELTFSPHYMQHTNRYGIYFELTDADTAVMEDESDKYVVIDSLPVANDQYEFSHNLDGDLTNTGTHKGLNYRDAAPGGYFSYEFAVEEGVTNLLFVKYFSGDAGRAFRITIDGETLEDEVIENINPDDFYDWYYEIPTELTEGKDTITVTFEANGTHYAGGIFDKIGIAKEKE
ncbi:MAG: glycoside hydrolase family 127 protein [Lachnospiraceae bacterium]|nr:glycoside hydrolase family 127 protein [Lachnospiraceae bacterium]